MLLMAQRDFRHQVERSIRIHRIFGQRAAQPGEKIRRIAGEDRMLLVSAQGTVDHHVDDPVAEAAHLVGLHAERIGRHAEWVVRIDPRVVGQHLSDLSS
ncbi:MAG TPA: hypothetical protein PKA33_13020 [Amaricoccus sp.]|uniref:hypothetical protein n=1 Tax=Amaricoccus sp. TaxID=1872485 RepID=UPI002C355DE8|nr:hypothetical protein [Amaricoccus sp.]HMU00274.1 hypothetical protein [Amaricoccus sp.]